MLLIAWRKPTWLAATVTACGACLAYYLLLYAGRALALSGIVPAFAGAWLANAVGAGM